MHNHLYNPEDGNEQRDHQRELPFEVRLGISTIRCCNNTVLPRRGRVGVRRVDCKDSVTAYWPIPAELTASAYASNKNNFLTTPAYIGGECIVKQQLRMLCVKLWPHINPDSEIEVPKLYRCRPSFLEGGLTAVMCQS